MQSFIEIWLVLISKICLQAQNTLIWLCSVTPWPWKLSDMTPFVMGFSSHWYKAIYEFSLKSNLYFSQKFGNKLKMPLFGYVLWPRDLKICRTWPLLKWVSDLIAIKPYANFHSNLTCTFLKNLVTSQKFTDDGQIWITKPHLVTKWQVS